MKRFEVFSRELSEFRAPKGHSLEKRDVHRLGEEKLELTITSEESAYYLFLNGQEVSETYNSLKDAENDSKEVKSLLSQMVNEGITVGEIIDEINL
jgi:hypothetical protein